MSRERRVADLETLLERVRRNAARPRPRRAPVVAAPEAAPAPAAVASVPVPAADEGPSGWSEPPIELSARATPEPERIALDSVSSIPPGEVVPLPEVRESAPVPLVRVAVDSEPAPAPPPMLELVAEPVPVPAHIEGATIEAADDARAMDDFTEDDIEEMSPDLLESVPPSVRPPAAQETFVEPVESEPASSPRPIWTEDASGMGREPAAAEEREIPIHTPPPESGPQEALPAHVGVPPLPDFDRYVDDGAHVGPTPEQLGGVVEFVGPAGADLELDDKQTVPPPSSAPSELEAAIPLRSAMLEPEPAPPPWQPEPAPSAAVALTEPGSVVTRPAVDPSPVVQAVPAPAAEGPLSFTELLDRSLEL